MRKSSWLFTAAACFCFVACKAEKKEAPPTDTTSSGNPLTAPADYVGALGKAQKSAQKTVGGLGLDQAIKAFSAEEGRYPNDLDELVSKGTISSIPKPPPGMKYDYDSKAGTIKVVPQ